MQINLRNTPGTPLEVTNENVGWIESFLSEQPEVTLSSRSSGAARTDYLAFSLGTIRQTLPSS